MTRIFYEELVCIVVGKNKCRKEMMIKNISQWSTIFEETLTYWLLENNKDKWIYDIDGKDIPSEPSSNVILTESSSTDESSIQGIPLNNNIFKTKYTSSKQGNTKYKSWNQKGIKRFNEILKIVHAQRRSREGKLYEDQFLAYMIEKHDNKKNSSSTTSTTNEEEVTIITGIGTDLNDAMSLIRDEENSQGLVNEEGDELIADDSSHLSCNVHSQLPDTLQFTQLNNLTPLQTEGMSKPVSDSESHVSDKDLDNEDEVQRLLDAEKRTEVAVGNTILATKKYNELAVKYDKAVESSKKPSKGKKKNKLAALKRTLTQLENAKQAALDAEAEQENARKELLKWKRKIESKANMNKRIRQV